VVRGIETVDASTVETSVGLKHAYYADNSTILSDLFAVDARHAAERSLRASTDEIGGGQPTGNSAQAPAETIGLRRYACH